jgi:hypothetical protein
MEDEDTSATLMSLRETVQQLRELLRSRESDLYSLQEDLTKQERESREALQECQVKLDLTVSGLRVA